MNVAYFQKLEFLEKWLSVDSWLFKTHYSHNFLLANNQKINTLVKPKYHLKLNYITVKIDIKDFNYSAVTYSLIFN